MLSIDQAIDIINESLEGLGLPNSPSQLYDPITYTLDTGGKRIRPALTLLACELFNGNYKNAIKPALGLEIFHNFTLLHDDIMDRSPIRRGRPTVYKKWDENTAILSGDTMFAIAYKQFSELEPKILSQVFPLFTQTAIEVCEGQQFDMNFESMEMVQMSEYIEMIRLKTAVLIAASLKAGSLVAGANKSESSNIYEFGEKIGIAFQLQDDLLDTYGKTERFGKSIGNDILTNKHTFLKIKAFEKADNNQKTQLKKSYSIIDPKRKIEEVIRLFDELDLKNGLIENMYSYLREGIAQLDKIDASEKKKEQLRNYARFMIERDY